MAHAGESAQGLAARATAPASALPACPAHGAIVRAASVFLSAPAHKCNAVHAHGGLGTAPGATLSPRGVSCARRGCAVLGGDVMQPSQARALDGAGYPETVGAHAPAVFRPHRVRSLSADALPPGGLTAAAATRHVPAGSLVFQARTSQLPSTMVPFAAAPTVAASALPAPLIVPGVAGTFCRVGEGRSPVFAAHAPAAAGAAQASGHRVGFGSPGHAGQAGQALLAGACVRTGAGAGAGAGCLVVPAAPSAGGMPPQHALQQGVVVQHTSTFAPHTQYAAGHITPAGAGGASTSPSTALGAPSGAMRAPSANAAGPHRRSAGKRPRSATPACGAPAASKARRLASPTLASTATQGAATSVGSSVASGMPSSGPSSVDSTGSMPPVPVTRARRGRSTAKSSPRRGPPKASPRRTARASKGGKRKGSKERGQASKARSGKAGEPRRRVARSLQDALEFGLLPRLDCSGILRGYSFLFVGVWDSVSNKSILCDYAAMHGATVKRTYDMHVDVIICNNPIYKGVPVRRVSDALKVAIPVVTLSFLTDWLRTGQRPDHMRYSSVPEDVMLAQCPRRTANLQHLAHDVKHRLLQWLGDLERVQLRATCRSWLKVQCSAATKILIKSKLSKKRMGRVRDLYAKVERVHVRTSKGVETALNAMIPLRNLTDLDISSSPLDDNLLVSTLQQSSMLAPRLLRLTANETFSLASAGARTALSSFLLLATSLTSLSLRDTAIFADDASPASNLQYPPSLTELDVAGNQFLMRGPRSFAAQLRGLTNLGALCLDACGLAQDIASPVLESLSALPQLECLSLNDNALHALAGPECGLLVALTGLTSLSLNNVAANALINFVPLFEGLSNAANMRRFSFASNPARLEDANALQVLVSSWRHLEAINLSRTFRRAANTFMNGADGGLANLRELDCSRHQRTLTGHDSMLRTVIECPQLERLNVSFNTCVPATLGLFADDLRVGHTSRLRELRMSKCGLSYREATAIFSATASLPHIAVIDLSYNDLSGFPSSHWQPLVSRPALRELHLSRTKLDIVCVTALLQATVECRSRVTVIDVEGCAKARPVWGFDYGMGGNEEGVGGEDRAALDVLHRAVGDVWTRNSHLRVLNLLNTSVTATALGLHRVARPPSFEPLNIEVRTRDLDNLHYYDHPY